jgi:hypothetical protein
MTLFFIWLGCVGLTAIVGGLMLKAYQRGYDAAVEAFDRGAEETRIKTAQDDALMEAITGGEQIRTRYPARRLSRQGRHGRPPGFTRNDGRDE